MPSSYFLQELPKYPYRLRMEWLQKIGKIKLNEIATIIVEVNSCSVIVYTLKKDWLF